jgi:hypothetical protein
VPEKNGEMVSDPVLKRRSLTEKKNNISFLKDCPSVTVSYMNTKVKQVQRKRINEGKQPDHTTLSWEAACHALDTQKHQEVGLRLSLVNIWQGCSLLQALILGYLIQ